MPTTGKIEGTDWLIYLAGTAVAHTTNGSISFSSETRETTTKDSLAKFRELSPTKKSGTCSLEGLVALDAALGIEELIDYWKDGTKVLVKFSTEVTSDSRWQFTGVITSLELAAPQYDNSTFSATIEVDGVIVRVANS